MGQKLSFLKDSQIQQFQEILEVLLGIYISAMFHIICFKKLHGGKKIFKKRQHDFSDMGKKLSFQKHSQILVFWYLHISHNQIYIV